MPDDVCKTCRVNYQSWPLTNSYHWLIFKVDISTHFALVHLPRLSNITPLIIATGDIGVANQTLHEHCDKFYSNFFAIQSPLAFPTWFMEPAQSLHHLFHHGPKLLRAVPLAGPWWKAQHGAHGWSTQQRTIIRCHWWIFIVDMCCLQVLHLVDSQEIFPSPMVNTSKKKHGK